MITDELFNIHSREIFVERLEQVGVDQNDMEFYNRFMSDMNLIDNWVMKKYPFVYDVEKELSAAWGLGIKDMIFPEEADGSKNWVINKLFHGELNCGETLYYSYEEAYDFIASASSEVAKRIENLC